MSVTLNEVIKRFLRDFNYLDSKENHRRTRRHEFWNYGPIKRVFNDRDLTANIEGEAQQMISELTTLASESGSQAFAETQHKFFTIIANHATNINKARFTHGTYHEYIKSADFGTVAYIHKVWSSKKPARFEKEVISGLNGVSSLLVDIHGTETMLGRVYKFIKSIKDMKQVDAYPTNDTRLFSKKGRQEYADDLYNASEYMKFSV